MGEWLGHPIVGDILYSARTNGDTADDDSVIGNGDSGGNVTTSTTDDDDAILSSLSQQFMDPNAGINRILESIKEDTTDRKEEKSLSSSVTTTTATTTSLVSPSSNITQEQAHAAREVCPTCNCDAEGKGKGGPSASFSPAQLLQGGHSICLHAFRYSLVFPVTTTFQQQQQQQQQQQIIDLQVDLPPWASH